jgi:4-alpha-glucanotransferase
MKYTGTAIPLGAIKTKKSVGCGEFQDLIPFADLCKKSGIKIIQLLPVNDTGTESSPYSALSAFALHPLYVTLEKLTEDEAIVAKIKKLRKKYKDFQRFPYKDLRQDKLALLREIFASKKDEIAASGEISAWLSENPWVKEYAVFMNLKDDNNEASYKQWPEHKDVDAKKIQELWDCKETKEKHLFFVWLQYNLDKQFAEAAAYVRSLGIMLKGDIPIMMNEDSTDAWANKDFFNDSLRAGSPVDNENPTGQNWGFPTYNWKNLEKADYSWWKNRLICASKYYDMYRIDHVLGFFRIWAIPHGECTAVLGHTEPFEPITKDELYGLGFNDDRIKWLLKPHVETRTIEEVNNNDYLGTHGLLHKIMDRIGNEELWLFKDSIKTDQDIWDCDIDSYYVKERLTQKWRDRMLIEVEGGYYPIWTYTKTTAWESLNNEEKFRFSELLAKKNEKMDKLWESQARTVLGELTGATKMIACAEDLGANIECLPSVLGDLDIRSLCVVRWKRDWEKPSQPYYAFESYPEKSVATASVHDSSTLRLWWTTEGDANDFRNAFPPENPNIRVGEYNPETAKYLLKKIATANSMYVINPIQDFLGLDSKYYAENMDNERVNVPGSVNAFNWTYRLPVNVEDLLKDKELIAAIKEIAKR